MTMHKIAAVNKKQSSTIVSIEKEVRSIDAHKLLSYVFVGTFLRNNSIRMATLLSPNKDQYFLKEGDHFSSDNAVIKEITSKGVIVFDENNKEYFFQFHQKAIKLD